MTLRLFRLVKDNWASFDGYAASRNIDPLEMPPDRMMSYVYWWATYRASDEQEVAKFDRRLWRPPVGVAPAPGSPWSPEAETAAFAELASVFGTATAKKPS